MRVREIIKAFEARVPLALQESYDNAGLQCGRLGCEVSRVLTCLDVTPAVVEEAIAEGCQMIVSHHPLLFHGVKKICPEHDTIGEILTLTIRHDLVIYAAHTNYDRVEGGVNYQLAAMLGLTEVQPMQDCGVWGRLSQPLTGRLLLSHVATCLHTPLRYNHDFDLAKTVNTMALCGGAGGDFIAEAEALCVDAYLTGELHYHAWMGHSSLLLLEAGHYETECATATWLARLLMELFPALTCVASQRGVLPCPYYLPQA